MEVLTEVVGCRPPARVGPEDVHYLLAVEAMAGSQGEQLHQGRRLPEAPDVLVDRFVTYCDPKATE